MGTDAAVTWLGIDFSGDHLMWRSGCRRTNVWIATISEAESHLLLHALEPIQALRGEGSPFERLVARLARRDFAAAGIDAPFSVPRDLVPDESHDALLGRVASIPVGERPFPEGRDLVEALRPTWAPRGKQVYRETEKEWRRFVNVRSTMWAGPRGGAAMTAACLRLLAARGSPIWPWAGLGEPGLLVEAFPAAQLRAWDLPWRGYDGRVEGASVRRAEMVRSLEQSRRLDTGPFRPRLLESADALDAVVCAFAAIAVGLGRCVHPPRAGPEGWIAVHVR